MFLVSGPELVLETCRAGFIGSFPSYNQRTPEGFGDWLHDIDRHRRAGDAPFAVQFGVHPTNPRLSADLELTIAHQVPIVITALGITREFTDAIHAYGGLVFHDATTIRHARKALEVNVDGIIAVCAGAGGHAGTYNPFAFIGELKPLLAGRTLIVAGGISSGAGVAGAIAAGADLVSLGTVFINTAESMAPQAMKQMIVDSTVSDIVYTEEVSGVPASFLAQTLKSEHTRPLGGFNVADEISPKIWKDIWSAGQGVGSVNSVVPVAELADRLVREYRATLSHMASLLTMEAA
ncbi:nitronate monooxygenase [Sphingomonas sp. CROZ-RG-20F-R02-07]|uniref:NAD(P)H-dependent flavin oxidoreductase n=1 Tax=Sphingomonas sp. CROZ-RG-20F-R02-07 TaxID=2914832 RepID=UPI001F58B8A5|nr:nitronate monooxygenase [Sphingomonas sp. CROZ-RG-20F-R02-07]